MATIITKTLQDNIDHVNKIFNEESCAFSAEYSHDDIVQVNIENGDWKHSHLYCDYIMSHNGFKKIEEEITFEDGDDSYSSIHYFSLAN